MVDFEKTFLARVPALLESGLLMEDAMQRAYDIEQMLASDMIRSLESPLHTSQPTGKYADIIRTMSDMVYEHLRSA